MPAELAKTEATWPATTRRGCDRGSDGVRARGHVRGPGPSYLCPSAMETRSLVLLAVAFCSGCGGVAVTTRADAGGSDAPAVGDAAEDGGGEPRPSPSLGAVVVDVLADAPALRVHVQPGYLGGRVTRVESAERLAAVAPPRALATLAVAVRARRAMDLVQHGLRGPR